MKIEYHNNKKSIRLGFYSSIFLSTVTLITFVFAMTATPISGAFCQDNCITYPYLDTLSRFPLDYIWMFFAFFLLLAYVVFVASVHLHSSRKTKVFSHIGINFAIMSVVVLLIAYFSQFSVIPAGIMTKETDGLPFLTQYNPQGLFIALEELGYILMSFSFLFIAPAFSTKNRIESTIRWIFIIAFGLMVVSFIGISIKYGILRKDRFEVAVISINWLVLIVNGFLTSLLFKGALDKHNIIKNNKNSIR